MAGVNNCHFVGNVGRDPETRSTNTGKLVANFSLGVNERKDGDTLWLNVVCFDKLATVVEQYVNKGKQVYVSGRLQIRKYQAKDGTEKTATELVANTVQFLGGKSDAPRSSEPPADEFADAPASKGGNTEIPF